MKFKTWRWALAVIGLVVGMGWGIVWLIPGDQPVLLNTSVAEKADPHSTPDLHALEAKKQELDWRFNQAVAMLHAKQYDYAIKALHRVLELAPRMPEAHVNMGYAFLGGGDLKAARDFFTSALEINPKQMNAYYGLAMAAEAQGDMEVALGAMRTYVHLSSPEDPYLARARAALWEWQEARDQPTKLHTDRVEDVSEVKERHKGHSH